uniref:Uncharacterized protein n=1 Tax=Ascaris lumbricoides TaxID=6252 RepID=A0A0M3IP11_ASCLU
MQFLFLCTILPSEMLLNVNRYNSNKAEVAAFRSKEASSFLPLPSSPPSNR